MLTGIDHVVIAVSVRLGPSRAEVIPPATIHLAIAGASPAEVDLLGCRWVVRPG